MIERITILGGSSVYTPEFIFSLFSHNINVSDVMLVGRNDRKLEIVAEFCKRILKKSGFPTTISRTTDLEEGVENAKYIINQIRVGGMKARMRDEKLPVKFGMIGDESLGAGGFTNAMRTLPIVMDYAKRIEKISPDATFIDLTNPMGIIVEALIKYSNLKIVGVCDLPGTYIKKVAEVLHHPASELDIDYIGLNHMGWIQDVKYGKRSFKSTLLDRLERHTDDGFDNELIELFRMIPTSTVSAYFHQNEVLKRQKSCSRFRAEILYEAEKQIIRLYEDKRLNEIPELTRERNAVWYDETIIPLIEALESRKDHNLILCIRNDGAIRDLPENCSVEIPAKVSKRGIRPRKVGGCPHFLKGLFIAVKESDRLIVEAVRHKSYEYALQSLIVNPLVPSLDGARKFLDRVIASEKLELH